MGRAAAHSNRSGARPATRRGRRGEEGKRGPSRGASAAAKAGRTSMGRGEHGGGKGDGAQSGQGMTIPICWG